MARVYILGERALDYHSSLAQPHRTIVVSNELKAPPTVTMKCAEYSNY